MPHENRSEDPDPFAEIGDDLRAMKSRPMTRGEIARKILAGVILVVGTIVLVVLFLFTPVDRVGSRGKVYLGLGALIWAFAFALYDGRVLYYFKRGKWHDDWEKRGQTD